MELENKNYTDFDYLELAKIYSKNEWIRHKTNFKGFENLWYDFDKEEKLIIRELISNFNYLSNEDAEIFCEEALVKIIKEWELKPENCFFVGTKIGTSPDGSEIFINFLKGILRGINDEWGPLELFSNIEESKIFLNGKVRSIKKPSQIDKIILIDDFVGTGGTANSRIEHYKQDLEELNIDAEVYFFSLAGMKSGFNFLKEKNRVYYTCLQLEKGVDLSYDCSKRDKVRGKVKKMESILSDYLNKKKLSEYSLGWGGSEALYSWTRNNIPNNVFPIFWWSRYKNNSKRKTMFNRMQ
ncbi:hypothetical protein [Lutibacter sp.]|uniref:phosphoribosyltransferase-like protein n=1 Tax=Lutibacter sp. TaxID=1925666 RepID=UPI0035616627